MHENNEACFRAKAKRLLKEFSHTFKPATLSW